MNLQELELDHISPSSISTYLDSPLRWRQHYIEGVRDTYGFALHRGIVVHSVLERYFTHLLHGIELEIPLYEALPAWVEGAWHKEYADHNAAFESTDKDLIEVISLVQSYIDMIGESVKPVAIEAPFALDLPYAKKLTKMIGRIDLIGEIDGKLVVIDFKTSGRKKSLSDVRHDPQAIIYGMAMRKEGVEGKVPFRYDQMIFKSKPEIAILERTVFPEEMDRFEELFLKPFIKTLEWQVEEDAFFFSPSARYGTGF